MTQPQTAAGRALLDWLVNSTRTEPYDSDALAAILAIEEEAREQAFQATKAGRRLAVPWVAEAIEAEARADARERIEALPNTKYLPEGLARARWYHVGRPWMDRPGMIYAGSEDPHAGTFVADCGDDFAEPEETRFGPAVCGAVADLIVWEHNKRLVDDDARR